MGPNDLPSGSLSAEPKDWEWSSGGVLADIPTGLGLHPGEPVKLKRQRRKERKAKNYLILKE